MNTVLKTFVESVIELLIGGVALVKYSVWQISRFFFFVCFFENPLAIYLRHIYLRSNKRSLYNVHTKLNEILYRIILVFFFHLTSTINVLVIIEVTWLHDWTLLTRIT